MDDFSRVFLYPSIFSVKFQDQHMVHIKILGIEYTLIYGYTFQQANNVTKITIFASFFMRYKFYLFLNK